MAIETFDLRDFFKDRCTKNRHPKNKDPTGGSVEVDRPPLFEVYLRMAEMISKRSTCSRLQVGCVLTDMSLKRVLAVGYNGNAQGFPNQCDDPEKAGGCGCLHSERNALIKSPGSPEKVAFITDSPCTMCAKAMVNANVKYVYYRRKYRLPLGLDVLEQAEIPAIHYTKWEDKEWSNE